MISHDLCLQLQRFQRLQRPHRRFDPGLIKRPSSFLNPCTDGPKQLLPWRVTDHSMLASLAHRKSSPPAKGSDAVVNESLTGPPNAGQGFWLNAHHDPVASLKTFSTCLHTCDLYGDGDWRLAVAGLDKKLKVDLLTLHLSVGLAPCLLTLGPDILVGLEGHTAGLRACTAGHSMRHHKLLC